MSNKSWNESLDEMLAKLNNGEFVDQSLNEFEKTLNDTVLGNKNKSAAYSTFSTTNYRTVVPHINRSIENAAYSSRYDQILSCLENIIYDNYPDSKQNGYKKAVETYIEEIKNHQNDLKALEARVQKDLSEYKKKVRSTNVDDYLNGYYDALLMIKKIMNNSRLARLSELNNKIGK
ncbi:MAG: hypothetical protein Q4C64_01380 [Erysipelotrichia bacterium]|nr:hypothetical protein [Erysipelotrichia bacterium]